ncbi:MAG TPA: hypothetical protein DDZ51_04020 [Planctomycetaceae bacterium]|nr:hypothetical protein [Planctomycetaceae bacterium]
MVQQAEVRSVAVPYLPAIQIECEAESLLVAFGRRFVPIVEPPVPAVAIARELLGLRIEAADLKRTFANPDVHGAIWFRDRKIAVDHEIDPQRSPANEARFRFTLAHEIGHWRLHRRWFLQEANDHQSQDRDLASPDVVCRSGHRATPIEWQADQFASLLLIPRKMLLPTWTAFRAGDSSPVDVRDLLQPPPSAQRLRRIEHRFVNERQHERAAMEHFCRPLADRFGVSAQAMRIRLESLGLFVRKRRATP